MSYSQVLKYTDKQCGSKKKDWADIAKHCKKEKCSGLKISQKWTRAKMPCSEHHLKQIGKRVLGCTKLWWMDYNEMNLQTVNFLLYGIITGQQGMRFGELVCERDRWKVSLQHPWLDEPAEWFHDLKGFIVQKLEKKLNVEPKTVTGPNTLVSPIF